MGFHDYGNIRFSMALPFYWDHPPFYCLQTSVLRKKLSLIDANILHVMTQVCDCMGSYTSMRAIDQTIVIDQTVQNNFERRSQSLIHYPSLGFR